MQLEKFYLDVVSRDGSGCIGYALQLGGFCLAATLEWKADGSAPRQRRTVRGTLPVFDERGLSWHCLPLAVDGTWTAREPPLAERTLWRDDQGSVRWHVVAPAAAVDLRLDGRSLSGWGYAERLRLDVAPWHLPIDTLRWGRFVAPGHNVVWIDWIHATPRRWLWHDGVELPAVAIDDLTAAWPGWRLEFGGGRSLRAGRLGDTVLARWPGARRWWPKRIQTIEESKWCATGTLTGAGNVRAQGWVIHECVRLR